MNMLHPLVFQRARCSCYFVPVHHRLASAVLDYGVDGDGCYFKAICMQSMQDTICSLRQQNEHRANRISPQRSVQEKESAVLAAVDAVLMGISSRDSRVPHSRQRSYNAATSTRLLFFSRCIPIYVYTHDTFNTFSLFHIIYTNALGVLVFVFPNNEHIFDAHAECSDRYTYQESTCKTLSFTRSSLIRAYCCSGPCQIGARRFSRRIPTFNIYMQ